MKALAAFAAAAMLVAPLLRAQDPDMGRSASRRSMEVLVSEVQP